MGTFSRESSHPLEFALNWRSLLVSVLFPCSFASAQVTLPKVISDHMAMQRDLPGARVGRATAGEQVTVTFRNGDTRSSRPTGWENGIHI